MKLSISRMQYEAFYLKNTVGFFYEAFCFCFFKFSRISYELSFLFQECCRISYEDFDFKSAVGFHMKLFISRVQ